MPVIDSTLIHTNPGFDHLCPFSPPEGWEGDSEAYLALMRIRYRDVMHGQRMVVISKRSSQRSMRFDGPFGDEAIQIIYSLNKGQR